MVEVPARFVGWITGKKGATLRMMEEEWSTLVLLAAGDDKRDVLAVYGSRWGRRGVELKVMGMIENKCRGFFTDLETGKLHKPLNQPGDDEDDDWDYDSFQLSSDQIAYILGSEGSTRRKLQTASGAILEYIGETVVIAGPQRLRSNCRQYINWLLTHRDGQPIADVDWEERTDCEVLKVPGREIGFIAGYKGETLRHVEKETSTFCFIDGFRRQSDTLWENVIVCSHSRRDRERAARMLRVDIEDKIEKSGGGDDRRRDRSVSRNGRSMSMSRVKQVWITRRRFSSNPVSRRY
eukprot:gnl/MRDRNA2_/MRDRNA2_83217_c0_seq1.p1 gnl/MRDRNA2_/MRDRNA2_83217_c0~~gnl/MRDRNA2_/MRDRNA2_83217_c0_seq1.p1  ORF type:complete len:294 (+),score=35.67 gnl/MRDRNA2_/MRDRNA2_83217_c0_seq1:230-1111(+)